MSDDPRTYIRIAAWLRENITSGALAPGSPTPNIREISERYGYCARTTAGKGLQLLVGEGLVVRYPGLGYYVAVPRPAGQDPAGHDTGQCS